MRCWCGHAKESHGPRRDGEIHCWPCHKAGRYFEPKHSFRPIGTLRPLPAILFGKGY